MEETSGAPKSKNNLAWPVFFLMVLLVAAVGVAGYFGYQNNRLVQQATAPGQEAIEQAQNAPTTAPTVSVPSPASAGSEITPVDASWNLYTNQDLGFSIKFPKAAMGDAPCELKTGETGRESYRPVQGSVPVKVFEEPSGLYFAHEYRYELTGETVENGVSYFTGCEKVANSLAYLQANSPRTWHIVSQKVVGDAELTAFIQAQFQPACQLGEKTVSTQPGVFDVKVLGDGKEPGESECFLNYMYVVKYSPEKQRVWKWDLGQAFTFYEAGNEEYDSEMKNSFKVL